MKIFPSCFILIFGYFPQVTKISYFAFAILMSFNGPKIDTAEAIFPHASFLVVYSSSSKFSFQWFTKTSIISLLHKVRVFFSFFFLRIYSLNISSITLSMPHWLVVYNFHSYNILSAKYLCSAIVCSVKSPFFKCWWSYKSMACMKVLQKNLVLGAWIPAVFFTKNICLLSNKCAQ